MRFGGVDGAARRSTSRSATGEIFALIGPNGAGKTTVFNVVTGVYRPTEGAVVFDGDRISGLKRHKVTKRGIARTFQNIRLFHNMTALENVMVGADAHHRTGAIGAALGLPWHRREEREGRERARELLEFVGIAQAGRGDGEEPALRRPAPAGDRPGAGHRPEAAAARRARRGHEPGGEGSRCRSSSARSATPAAPCC